LSTNAWVLSSKLRDDLTKRRRVSGKRFNNPRDSDTHYNLGNVLHAQRRLAEAEKSYRQAIRLDPLLAFVHEELAAYIADE
jgi:tetratricopeptide (TPR) repeat protein